MYIPYKIMSILDIQMHFASLASHQNNDNLTEIEDEAVTIPLKEFIIEKNLGDL